MKLGIIAVAAILLAGASASAKRIPINFENQPLTTGASVLNQPADRVNTILSRPSATFDIVDISGMGAPASWGHRTLSPFTNSQLHRFIISFDYPVDGISIEIGDADPDVDTFTIIAFPLPNAQGVALGYVTGILQGGNTTFTTTSLTAAFAGARSFRFQAGPNETNTVYYDNLNLILPPNAADFDADDLSDFSVFRPSDGNWYALPSSGNGPVVARHFGLNGDRVAAGDFDGDGAADLGVFRGGIWYIMNSQSGAFSAVQFGLDGDIPEAVDFDGDGRSDVAVYRPSNSYWFILRSTDNQFQSMQLGSSGDIPVPGYYRNTGKSHPGVFRPSTGIWITRDLDTGGLQTTAFGQSGDLPLVADFDGDQKSDLTVFRPSEGIWYTRLSTDGTARATQFGTNGDVPVAGIYQGSVPAGLDPRANIAVFRPSNGFWYVLQRDNGGLTAQQWGANGDVPVTAANLVQ